MKRRVRVHPFLRIIDLLDVEVGQGRAALGMAVLALPEWSLEDHEDFRAGGVGDGAEGQPLLGRQGRVEPDGGSDGGGGCHDGKVAIKD